MAAIGINVNVHVTAIAIRPAVIPYFRHRLSLHVRRQTVAAAVATRWYSPVVLPDLATTTLVAVRRKRTKNSLKSAGRAAMLRAYGYLNGVCDMEVLNEEIRNRVNIREIYRYLGYGTKMPDDSVNNMIDEVLTSLINVIQPKNVYKIDSCSASETVVVLKGAQRTLVFESRNLARNLAQCGQVILIAATLGLEADKLLQKYEMINMTKAAIAQACGAACIEAYCNILQEQICETVSTDDGRWYLRPRFSPGYGDLPLQYQKVLFEELECTKRIGLTLTDSLLMVPTKSVSALIGLTKNAQSCHIGKCRNCDRTACEFRDAAEAYNENEVSGT